jgi:hypothetical protein
MTPEGLRQLVESLQRRVRLDSGTGDVVFDEPDRDELVAQGYEPSEVDRLLGQPWWPEMIDDVVETPAFCAPDDPPEQVLQFARDVIRETIGKRFPLTPEG